MLFQTIQFAIFFLIFSCLFFLARQKNGAQNLLIVIASYYFYAAWDERFLFLIAISTSLDYLLGYAASGKKVIRTQLFKSIAFISIVFIYSFHGKPALYLTFMPALGGVILLLVAITLLQHISPKTDYRRLFVTISIFSNLSILAFFKYYNFFADSFIALLNEVGLNANHFYIEIILPVGISFYTFQTISYSVDAYRKDIAAEKELLPFAAFVSFFPQLVAGPIERASHLLPMFSYPKTFDFSRLKSGILLFFWGLYKKVCIADNLAPISDLYFSSPANFSSLELILGVFAFTFQIYCDFSGYSDMARGIARTLGFNLTVNFNLPYFSRTPSEFWQRWHISLSSWLRDYLYIPIGGNRGNALNTYRNLLTTMVLGGLWHGANWTFVTWGCFHGLILILYRAADIDNHLRSVNINAPLMYRMLTNILLTTLMFILTLFGWLIFRSENLTDLFQYISGILAPTPMIHTEGLLENGLLFTKLVSPLIMIQVFQKYNNCLEIWTNLKPFNKLNFLLFVTLSLIFLSNKNSTAFIYFDF